MELAGWHVTQLVLFCFTVHGHRRPGGAVQGSTPPWPSPLAAMPLFIPQHYYPQETVDIPPYPASLPSPDFRCQLPDPLIRHSLRRRSNTQETSMFATSPSSCPHFFLPKSGPTAPPVEYSHLPISALPGGTCSSNPPPPPERPSFISARHATLVCRIHHIINASKSAIQLPSSASLLRLSHGSS